jgi:hypothetical protein
MIIETLSREMRPGKESPMVRFMVKSIVCLAAGGLLSGCLLIRDNTDPAYVSDVPYRALSCEELAAERDKAAAVLADAYRSGGPSYSAPFLVWSVPITSLSGQKRVADIRQTKGELQVIERIAQDKGCNLPEIPDPTKAKTSASK